MIPTGVWYLVMVVSLFSLGWIAGSSWQDYCWRRCLTEELRELQLRFERENRE